VFVAATLESVKKAIGKKSSSLAFAWLADLERKAGKPDVALDTVNTGLSYLHDYLPGLLVRSAIYFDLERFDEVIEACEFIVKKDPFCIAAWRRLGAAYHKINQIGKRNFCYRMVHDMDPLDSFWKEEYTFIPPEDIAVEEKAEELESVSNDVSKSVDLQDDSFEIPSEEAANMALATPPDLSNEDPFSLLTNLLPSDEDNAEDASLESLESTLDNVMDKISGADEGLPEFFGGDDISENDVSSAFSSMFGMEDDLPSEKTVSPFASFEIPTSIDDEEDVPEPEPVATVSEEVKPEKEEEKPQSLSSAFDDIFGQDELPEEFSASDDLTKDTFEKSDVASELEKSASNDLVDNSFENMFEKSDVVSDIEKSISEEIEESSFETMFEKNDVSRVTESPISDNLVDNSFENTFEKSNIVSEIDNSLVVEAKKVESKKEAEEFVSAVDSSLSALFGEDDLDLPKENKPVPADESNVKNNIENSFSALFGEDDDLELPSIQNAEEPKNDGAILRSIEEDVGHSFSALFGKDDDSFDSFEKKKESPVLSSSDLEPPLRPVEVNEEVSGAFASLFSLDEDDDLPKEKSKERDGVDFLMSGDSDDEMAVALMKNPSASLDQDEVLLDENLNTKTLAEIYFEQGLYSKALNIYQDLVRKNPLDLDLQKRLSDIQRQVNEKFGDA
jgi:hypothetical protein